MKLFEILDAMPDTEKVQIVEDTLPGHKDLGLCGIIQSLYKTNKSKMEEIEHCEVINLYPLADNYDGAKLLIAIAIEE